MHVACNPLKLMAEAKQYKNISSPLVVPISLLSNQVKEKLKKVKTLDFGVGLKDNSFRFYNSCSYIPKLYTVAYALSIATVEKLKRYIWLDLMVIKKMIDD